MKPAIATTALLLALLATPALAIEAEQAPARRPLVQLAILLDTSSSMTGLIEQAKTQLWAIVNEFATAQQHGVTIELQVALYEYGKSSLPSKTMWIRQILPLTTDLDEVSKQLFVLRTNGGKEYCGAVIQRATEDLKWSDASTDMKAVFIAGNEPFTQGPVDYKAACSAAIAKGIVVNTIHCGSEAAGLSGKWADGAKLADGKYMCINQNRRIVHIDAPQDKRIAELGTKLNKTYVAYGVNGKAMAERQIAQDHNAEGVSAGSNVQRQIAKGSAQYRNENWDLVDALREGKVDLAKIDEKLLPETMRKMTVEQRVAHIKTQQESRLRLQKEIQQLGKARRKFVAAKRKEIAAKTGEKSLDEALLQAAREQAKRLNIEVK